MGGSRGVRGDAAGPGVATQVQVAATRERWGSGAGGDGGAPVCNEGPAPLSLWLHLRWLVDHAGRGDPVVFDGTDQWCFATAGTNYVQGVSIKDLSSSAIGNKQLRPRAGRGQHCSAAMVGSVE